MLKWPVNIIVEAYLKETETRDDEAKCPVVKMIDDDDPFVKKACERCEV